MRHHGMAAMMVTGLLAVSAAHAQDYGTPITVAQAKSVAAAALAEAARNNWRMAIAIVEPSGALVYFEKMDGTQYASVEIAPGKARSAAIFRRPTKEFEDRLANGAAGVLTLEGVVGTEGGLPIVMGGKIIGAIGVSGGTSAQDGVAARAGTAVLQ